MSLVASSLHPDILALTETWLNNTVADGQIKIPFYSMPFREDRKDGRIGGGVCCYIRSDIYCKLATNLPPPPNIIDCLSLIFPLQQIILILVYVPPSLPANVNRDIVTFLTKYIESALVNLPDSKLLLMGDFNHLPLTDIENIFSLTQLVNFNTRGNALLDKIFVDEGLKQTLCEALPCPAFGKSDHIAIFVPASKISGAPPSRLCKIYDYRKANMTAVMEKLMSVPWENWYRSSDDINTKVAQLYDIMYDAMRAIPSVLVKMNVTDKCWMTPTLKHLINCKHVAFRAKNFPLYAHYKEKVKLMIQKAKNKHLQTMKDSKKDVWKIARNLTNDYKSISKLETLVNQYPSPSIAAGAINKAFCIFSLLRRTGRILMKKYRNSQLHGK